MRRPLFLLLLSTSLGFAACASSETDDHSAADETPCERQRDEAIERTLADFGDLPADVRAAHRAQLREALARQYAVLCEEQVP